MSACFTCDRVGPVDAHHLAGRIGNVPQSDLTIPVCKECHKYLTRWQRARWNGHKILSPAEETLFAWLEIERLAAMRSGITPGRITTIGERAWRAATGALPPLPISTLPPAIGPTRSDQALTVVLSEVTGHQDLAGPLHELVSAFVIVDQDQHGMQAERLEKFRAWLTNCLMRHYGIGESNAA